MIPLPSLEFVNATWTSDMVVVMIIYLSDLEVVPIIEVAK